MLYIRVSYDKAGAGELRERLRADHRAYVKPNTSPNVPCRVLQAGPLCVSDEDNTNLASFMILEAKSIADVMRFHENDPFTKGGLYEKSHIHRWDRHVG
jgi:uncharacterized protein